MEGKIRVTVIATGFENKVQNKPEPVKVPVVEEPIIKDENVIDTSEFSKILNNTITSSTDSGVKSSDSLNGSFVTKDELNTNSYGSFAGLSQKEPAKENSERQSWGQSLFDNDVQKEISNNKNISKYI